MWVIGMEKNYKKEEEFMHISLIKDDYSFIKHDNALNCSFFIDTRCTC